MLKSCFLDTATPFPNYSNKICGEIICQTETTFLITCKFCEIKIFDYDEFIKHFHQIHWPEMFDEGVNKQTPNEDELTNEKPNETDKLVAQNQVSDEPETHRDNDSEDGSTFRSIIKKVFGNELL